jgi:hypothetical protein
MVDIKMSQYWRCVHMGQMMHRRILPYPAPFLDAVIMGVHHHWQSKQKI